MIKNRSDKNIIASIIHCLLSPKSKVQSLDPCIVSKNLNFTPFLCCFLMPKCAKFIYERFLMKLDIFVGLILGFLVLLFTSVCGNVFLYLKNQSLNKELARIDTLLNVQNAQIKALELDTQNYACDAESLNNFTREKYKSVMSEHEVESCESKLAEFEKALGIYEKR